MDTAAEAHRLHSFITARARDEMKDVRRCHSEGCDKIVLGDWADCDCDSFEHMQEQQDDLAAVVLAAEALVDIAAESSDAWAASRARDGLLALAKPYAGHQDYPHDVEDRLGGPQWTDRVGVVSRATGRNQATSQRIHAAVLPRGGGEESAHVEVGLTRLAVWWENQQLVVTVHTFDALLVRVNDDVVAEVNP